jgi:membrane protein
MGDPSASASLWARVRRLVDRIVARVSPTLSRSWLFRVGFGSMRTFVRIELFDRAMTVAAQFFTSVFPLLIVMALWLNRISTNRIADSLSIPAGSREVLYQAVDSGSTATLGVVGFAAVLISGTSLSRALTRAYSAIWQLPRPRSSLRAAWRWLATLAIFAFILGVNPFVHKALGQVPPSPGAWQTVEVAACYLAVGLAVPLLLLERQVRVRLLMPGALLFAIVLALARPATSAFLPRALAASAQHYGTIGVAFTFISYLYVLSFVYLATACIGWVMATDHGRIGRWIRGETMIRWPGRRSRPSKSPEQQPERQPEQQPEEQPEP